MDDLLTTRFRSLLDPQLEQRRLALKASINAVKAQTNAAGMLRSSRTVLGITTALEGEFSTRSELAWETLRRVHGALGSVAEPTTRSALKSCLATFMSSLRQELESVRVLEIQGFQNPSLIPGIDAHVDSVQRRYEAEVDVYLDALQFNSTRADGRATAQYHFHAPVQVVQTGDRSVATVNQSLTPDQIDALAIAFRKAIAEISDAQSIDDDTRREIVAIAREASSELDSATPNRTKIALALSTVAQVIQTLGASKEAWGALTSVAQMLGIALP